MLNHYKNFHHCANSGLPHTLRISNMSESSYKKGVLKSLNNGLHLQGQPLITSQNSAFTEFRKYQNDYDSALPPKTSSQVIVIRVQVRSGSVVPGSSSGYIKFILYEIFAFKK